MEKPRCSSKLQNILSPIYPENSSICRAFSQPVTFPQGITEESEPPETGPGEELLNPGGRYQKLAGNNRSKKMKEFSFYPLDKLCQNN
jgi:hypothetical protein